MTQAVYKQPDRFFPPVPVQYLISIVAVLFWSFTTQNPLYTFEALAALIIVYFLTWRVNEPPILFIGLFLQWIQVVIKVFYANWINIDFIEIHRFPNHILAAYHTSLLGIVCIALGFFVMVRILKIQPYSPESLNFVYKWSVKRLLLAYACVFLFGNILLSLSGGLRQLVTAALFFKWSLFFFLYIRLVERRENVKLFLLIFLIEILTGVTGFFSNYKNVFFVVIICFLTFNLFLSNARFIALGLLCLSLFFFLTVWQSIKGEYRELLNSNTGEQAVTISHGEALQELFALVGKFDGSDMKEKIGVLAERASYIDIYSAIIGNIPSNIPHEEGKLWLEASLRAFQPRILFPDKTVADDSEKTIMYTGLMFSGAESNTSISMGYIPETYIDFGFKGMMVFLLFFGGFIGFVYHLVFTKSRNTTWGIAFLIPFFFSINSYEFALDKMVPAIFLYVIAWWLINKYIAEKPSAILTHEHPAY